MVRFSWCDYKDSLGVPGKGAHAYRLCGIAVVDVVLTVMLALIVYYFAGYNFWLILLALFGIGILLHWLFCVDTAFNRFIGL